MFRNTRAPPRGRGRPSVRSPEETRRLLVEAAGRQFRLKGFAATSMSEIAETAGISTRTIYRLIPGKAELLEAVLAAYLDRHMPAFGDDARDAASLPDALERLLIAYGRLALSSEAVAMNRLVLAECRQFPELSALFRQALGRLADAMAAWLDRHRDRGLLTLEDAGLAGEMLRGMMAMDPQRAVMLGQRSPPPGPEIAARARRCSEIFLQGCSRG